MIWFFEGPGSPSITRLVFTACAAVSSGGDGIPTGEGRSEEFGKGSDGENGVVVREGALRFEQSVAGQVLLDRGRRQTREGKLRTLLRED